MMGPVFKALADPTRRQILAALRERALNAGELAERVKLARSALSFHLNALMAAELIEQERRGQFLFYSLNTSVLEELIQFVLENFSDRAPARGAAARAKSRGRGRTMPS